MTTIRTSPAGQDRRREAAALYLRAQIEVARDRGDDVTAATRADQLADLTPPTATRTRTITAIGGTR